jgi:hypothetical protein
MSLIAESQKIVVVYRPYLAASEAGCGAALLIVNTIQSTARSKNTWNRNVAAPVTSHGARRLM